MKTFALRILSAIAAVQILWSCAALDEMLPRPEDPAMQNQRASIAMASLRDLEDIDAYIKLDNKLLREEIHNGLHTQARTTGIFEFSRLRARFTRQNIALEATVDILNGTDEPLTASLLGDVILTFSGNQLIWLPHFNELKITDSEFVFERVGYLQATNELEQSLLARVNTEIADAVIVLGKNMVQINPLPLGDIEVGATLTNLNRISSGNSYALGGVFTVAGSTILIEPAQTSIALDLGFIANISECPSDVYVSRSTFTPQIVNREPGGVTRFLGEEETKSHFFTEISGATSSTAVIHYWFADGRPVALEELVVEPSYRWRTWSSKTIDRRLARNWEVIVVEKNTGCILHSQAITTDPAISTVGDADNTGDTVTYAQYRSEFENRVSRFSILKDRPDIALIEVPRSFLRDTLKASLKDIQIVVNFDVSKTPGQTLTGNLQPFGVEDIVCEVRECGLQRECNTGFTQCTRQRDNRDCTTCLFRNPLNNRCINEAKDPICEAARAAQNAKYDDTRDSCMEQEAMAGMKCEKLAAQELRSCEIESASERSACEDAQATVQEFSAADSFAKVELKLETSGGLSAIFSNMEIEGDLENFRLNLGFSAALRLAGSVRFAPRQNLGPLAACMNSWQKSFNGTVVLPQSASNMIGTIRSTASAFSTDWSGYVVSAGISPTPLEDMFGDNPNLLADCQIGLTVFKVADAITGESRDYLSGVYPFEIQPSASRINLANATVQYGTQLFQAEPELTSTHLKFRVLE